MKTTTKIVLVSIFALDWLMGQKWKAEQRIRVVRPKKGWTYWLRSRLYSKLLEDDPPWPRGQDPRPITDAEWDEIERDLPPPRPRPRLTW